MEDREKALNGVLTGRFPVVRPTLGDCIIRSSGPSLWFPVAELFGFNIKFAVIDTDTFRTVLSPLYPATRFVPRLPRSFRPSLVFCDGHSLLPFTHQYWTTTSCPHLVAHSGVATPDFGTLPPDWIGFSHSVAHAQVGGATAGQFYVSFIIKRNDWSGQSHVPPLPQRPWSSVLHSLECRTYTPPLKEAPLPPWDPVSAVVSLEDGSFGAWGQFPVGRSVAPRFTMSSDRARSSWGQRRLTPPELADLWNTPISIQDAFVKAGQADALAGFTLGPPAKVLSALADVFITYFLRGGFEFWSAPNSCDEICGSKERYGRSSPTGPPAPLGPDLDALDQLIEKQDGQKSDDAEVPTYLWENYFRDALPLEWEGSLPTVYPLHPDWRLRLEAYRTLGVCVWRRNVHRSFWRWFKQRLPENIVSSNIPYVRWRGGRYQWTKSGRDRYQTNLARMLEHPGARGNWLPARECVEKAAAASWWEWHMGYLGRFSGDGPLIKSHGLEMANITIPPRLSQTSPALNRLPSQKRTGLKSGIR